MLKPFSGALAQQELSKTDGSDTNKVNLPSPKSPTKEDLALFKDIVQSLYKRDFNNFSSLLKKVKNFKIKDSNGYSIPALSILTADYKYLKETLKYDFDVNSQDKRGNTLIHLAAQVGHQDMLKLLVAKGANLNLTNKEGDTPLITAIYFGNDEFIRTFLSLKPDLSIKNNYGLNALHIAAYRGLDGICRWLLQLGAKVNDVDNDSISALHFAAGNGNLKTVQVLLEYKANLELKDKKGATPLYNAVVENHPHVVNYLIASHANINIVNAEGMDLFQAAIFYKKLTMAKMLTNFSFDYKRKDNKGYTALHYALVNNDLTLIKFLAPLSDLKVVDSYQVNDFMLAIRKIASSPVLLAFLSNKEVPYKEVDKNGNNLLYYTVLYKRNFLLDPLLQTKKVNFFLKNKNNETPLIKSIQIGNMQAYRFYLKNFKKDLFQNKNLSNQILALLTQYKHYYDARIFKKELWNFNKQNRKIERKITKKRVKKSKRSLKKKTVRRKKRYSTKK
jgi:ankyrin repeat protein